MSASFFSSLFSEMGLEYQKHEDAFVVAIDPKRSFQVVLRSSPMGGESSYLQVLIKRDYLFRIDSEAFVDVLQMIAIANSEMDAPGLTLLSEGNELGISFRQVHWTSSSMLDKELFKGILGQFLLLSDMFEPFLREAAEKRFSMEEFLGALEKAPGMH